VGGGGGGGGGGWGGPRYEFLEGKMGGGIKGKAFNHVGSGSDSGSLHKRPYRNGLRIKKKNTLGG